MEHDSFLQSFVYLDLRCVDKSRYLRLYLMVLLTLRRVYSIHSTVLISLSIFRAEMPTFYLCMNGRCQIDRR